MSSIHDGHRQRLKRQFAEHGGTGMNDIQFLEMLLYYAIPRSDTNELAHALLKRYGTIRGVLDAEVSDLQQVEGIGESTALFLKTVREAMLRYVSSPSQEKGFICSYADAGRYFVPILQYETVAATSILSELGGSLTEEVTDPAKFAAVAWGMTIGCCLPLILVLCAVGAYATNNRVFDAQAIVLFGVIGYLYHKFGLATTPFVLCFLIGNMLETYLRRGIMQYKSFGAFFARPIFDVFFFIAIGVVLWSVYKEIKGTKKVDED